MQTSVSAGEAAAIAASLSSPVPPDQMRQAVALEMLRASTDQCGRIYVDTLPDAVLLHPLAAAECPGSVRRALDALVRPPRRADAQPTDLSPLTLPGCALRWFTPPEACDLIARAGHLVLIGDSLSRHIATALHLILSGNYVSGAIRNERQLCIRGHSQ